MAASGLKHIKEGFSERPQQTASGLSEYEMRNVTLIYFYIWELCLFFNPSAFIGMRCLFLCYSAANLRISGSS